MKSRSVLIRGVRSLSLSFAALPAIAAADGFPPAPAPAAGVAPPLSDPTAGRLVRVEQDGSLSPLLTGLTFPTALVAGRDGSFYLSNCGYHCDEPVTGTSLAAGQVLRVTIEGAQAAAVD